MIFNFHENQSWQGWAYARGWKGKNGDLEAICNFICTYANSPCFWANGVRLKVNFRFAQWLGLDFDDGLSLKEACEIYRSNAHIIGTTRSHQKLKDGAVRDRFRVFLKLSKPCTQLKDYEYTIARLIEDLPADKACKDGARFFFPCQNIVSWREEGKTVPLLTAVSRNYKKREVRMLAACRGEKRIPPKIKVMLQNGVAYGTRNKSTYMIARDLKKIGFQQGEIVELIYTSAIPASGTEVFTRTEIERTVGSAFRH